MLKDIVRAYKNYPDYVAFVIDDTSYTYQEVFARVRGIMPFVQDCPEDIIGIIAEDRIETYASILAVLLSGKTYVILHPNYPDSRNRNIAEATGMKQVLYGHDSGTRQGLPTEITCISTVELRDEDREHAAWNKYKMKTGMLTSSSLPEVPEYPKESRSAEKI